MIAAAENRMKCFADVLPFDELFSPTVSLCVLQFFCFAFNPKRCFVKYFTLLNGRKVRVF